MPCLMLGDLGQQCLPAVKERTQAVGGFAPILLLLAVDGYLGRQVLPGGLGRFDIGLP